jgi:hypothetical protein
MRRALTKLLPEDHPSIEKRSCKRRDNNERPKYQNVRVSFSSVSFFFDSVLAVGRAAHCRSGWGVLSSITSFYGNGRTKFPVRPRRPRLRRRRGLTSRRRLRPRRLTALRGRGLDTMGIFRLGASHSARPKSAVTSQEATIAQVKSAIAEQMEAVTARLKEHDLQIPKVSVGSAIYLDESTGQFQKSRATPDSVCRLIHCTARAWHAVCGYGHVILSLAGSQSDRRARSIRLPKLADCRF